MYKVHDGEFQNADFRGHVKLKSNRMQEDVLPRGGGL